VHCGERCAVPAIEGFGSRIRIEDIPCVGVEDEHRCVMVLKKAAVARFRLREVSVHLFNVLVVEKKEADEGKYYGEDDQVREQHKGNNLTPSFIR